MTDAAESEEAVAERENTHKWFVVVNPVSGGGRGLVDWPHISKLLRESRIDFDYAFTSRRSHAAELAVEALAAGFRRLMVVGGDGTLHEVVNGVFLQRTVPPLDVLLGVIGVGSGNDWMRMFGVPRNYSEAVKAIAEGKSFLQDVGRITYHEANYRQSRYFVNGAGLGFDAYTIKMFTRLAGARRRRFGKLIYIRAIARALVGFRATRTRITVDGREVIDDRLFSVSVGIGKFSGGGLMQLPDAVADDGLFDVTVIRPMGILRVLLHFRSLFNGRIYEVPRVRGHRGRRIAIDGTSEVLVEADGELLGTTPVEFDILDRAIRVVVGPDITQNKR